MDEWRGFYVRYEDLKCRIEDFAAQLRRHNSRRSQSTGDLSGAQPRLGYLGRTQTSQNLQERQKETEASIRSHQMKTFAEMLDRDLTVLVCFSLEQQGRIAADVRRLIGERETLDFRMSASRDVEKGSSDEKARIVSELCHAGRELIHVVDFLDVNLTGVRKILKKYDKVLRSGLAVRYLQSRSGPWGILCGTRAQTLYTVAGAIATQLRELTSLDPNADMEGLISPRDRNVVIGGDSVMEAITVLEELKEARTRLEESQERISIDYLTLTSRVALETSLSGSRIGRADDVHSQRSSSPVSGAQFVNPDDFSEDYNLFRDWSHVLNLASTFLYMSNYYIVGPTGGAYAERLGGGSSLSATVIGCTPLMATVSTWTNTSFKRPLLWCSFLMLVGNLFYAVALPCEALWMVLAGRMINGLGGARGVNRRFIADCTTSRHRHQASAAFVAAGALGMAFGPATAAALKLLPTLEFYDGFVVNELTAPGYIMALLWCLHFLLVLACFRDPKRVPLPGKDSTKATSTKATDKTATGDKKKATAEIQPLLQKKKSVSYGSLSSAQNQRTGIPRSAAGDIGIKSVRDKFEGHARFADVENRLDHPGLVFGESLEAQEDEEAQGAFQKLASCFGRMDAGVLLMLWLFFVNKFTVEVLVSSAPSVTRTRFEFTTSECSLMMAVFGILVLPTNAVLSYSASRREMLRQRLEQSSLGFHDEFDSADGETSLILQIMMGTCVALALLLDLDDIGLKLHTDRYGFAVMLGFVLMQAQEGVLLSKLSKIIAFRSPESAKGTCNSGLLATEAGTIGRALGDAFLTFIATMCSHQSGANWRLHNPNLDESRIGLVNAYFGPTLVLLLISLWIVHRNREAAAV